MADRERWRRLTSLPWLASTARDAVLAAHGAVAPTRFAELYRTVRPHTMCGAARLRGLYRAVQHVVAHGIPGCLVECGAARGGSAGLMGLTLQRLGASRPLWVFDTFAGLPAPTEADGDPAVTEPWTGGCAGSLGEVEALFERLGIRAQAHLVKGLFQDTLPAADVGPIALLHIDGDWYESVRTCLEHLYDRVSPGGIIQLDDYGHWPGARKAVDEFRERRGITASLRWLDYTGRQFVKPGGRA